MQSSHDAQLRVHNLLKRYQYNPELFDEKDVDRLREMAVQQGIGTTKRVQTGQHEDGRGIWEEVDIFDPKGREVSEFRLKRIASQLQMGMVEGFTTIPVSDWTNKPALNTYESIAHSLGHLVGFAPGILAAPIRWAGGKLLTKGASRVGAKAVQSMNEYSIPMMFGGKVQNLAEGGLAKAGLESFEFLKKGSKARNIGQQSIHLGAASAASAVWKGPEAMMDAAVHGALAGGLFGGIGEFTRLGNIMKNGTPQQIAKAEGQLRTALGASFMGLPSYINKEPIEMIMYNTLLGGFFGSQSRPGFQMEGEKYMADLKYTDPTGEFIFRPKEHPDWHRYTKETQEYVMNDSPYSINKTARKTVLRNYNKTEPVDLNNLTERQQVLDHFFQYEAGQKFNTENPTKEQIDVVYREKAHDIQMGKAFGYEVVGRTKPEREDATYEDVGEGSSSEPPVKVRKTKETPDVKITENVKEGTVEIKKSNKPEVKEKTDAQKRLDDSQFESIVITIDSEGGTHYGLVNGEMQGKAVGEKRIDRPVEEMTSGKFYEIQYVRQHVDTTKKGQQIYKLENPMHTTIEGDKLIPTTSGGDFWKMELNMHRGGPKSEPMYIYSGIKDKNVLLAARYHLESTGKNRITKEELFEYIADGDPVVRKEIEKAYEESLKIEREWFDGKAAEESLREMHEQQWVSNVLYKSEAEGLYKTGTRDLTRIHEQFKGDGFARDVVGFNKRMQLMNDKTYKLENLQGEYKYAIMDDMIADQFGIDIKDLHASDTDGTVFYRRKVAEEMSKEAEIPGHEEGVTMNKPVMVVPGKNGTGTMVVKAAGKEAPQALREYMRSQGIDMIIFNSAAKYRGTRDVHKLHFDGEKYYSSTFDGGMDPNTLINSNTLTMKKSDVRINLGTRQDPKSALKKQKLVKQLFGVINNKQTDPELAQHIFENYFLPEIRGNENINKLVNEYRNSGEGSLKKIRLDDVDAAIAYEIINIPDHVATKPELALKKHLLNDLYRIDRESAERAANGENLDHELSMNDREWAVYNQKRQRILENGGMSDAFFNLFKFIKQDHSRKIQKYFIERYSKPKYEYSAKAWLAPKMPHMKLNPGEFKADIDWNPWVKGPDGKKMKLDKLWSIYENAKGDQKKNLEHLLDFTVIRVPADSISGVRVLKFRGFSNEKGVDVYTHGKDNEYLGGADKDSDSAFFYHGFDKKVTDAFKKNQYEWQGNKPDGEYVPGKSEKYNEDFLGKNWKEKQEPYKNKYSVFSPSMRKMVARSAARGNAGLGYGLTGRNIMVSWADFLDGQGGSFSYDILSKAGNKLGKVNIKLKENGHEIIRELGREMVNRSADAADYPSQIDYSLFRKLMFEKAFEGEVKWEGWYQDLANAQGKYVGNEPFKLPEFGYGLVANRGNSPFVQMKFHNKLLKPTEYTDGQKGSMNRESYQIHIENTASEHNFGNISQKINDQIRMDGVHKYEAPDIDILTKVSDVIQYHGKTAGRKDLTKYLVDGKYNKKDPNYIKDKRWNDYLDTVVGKYDKLNEAGLPGKIFDWMQGRPVKKDRTMDDYMEILGNDIYKIASVNNLLKSGFEIQHALIESGKTDAKNINAVVKSILQPIQDYSMTIKRRYSTQEKERGQDALKLDFAQMDAEISAFKNGALKEIAKANGIDKALLESYFDYHMLSSFMPRNVRDKIPLLSIQSKAINPQSVKNVVGEFNNIYQASLNKSQKAEEVAAKILADTKNVGKDPEVAAGKSESVEIKTDEITALVVRNSDIVPTEKPTIKKKEATEFDPIRKRTEGEWRLEDAGMSKEDFVQIKRLRDNLDKNPNFSKNFNEWFPSFTNDVLGMGYRDVKTMDMRDVKALNRYFESLQKRTSKWGSSVPRWIFRADPRTIDEHMATRDGQLFSSFDAPVIGKGGKIEFREVKSFMSTAGAMKEFAQRIHTAENSHIGEGAIQKELDALMPYRKLTVKDRDLIQELLVQRIEGFDYKSSDTYIKNANRKIEGKTLEQWVESSHKGHTEFMKNMSEKWIHSTGKEGKNTLWQGDKYIRYRKDGSVDVEHYFRTALEPSIKSYEVDVVPLETQLRFHYEYAMEKKIELGHWKKTRAEYRKKYKFNPVGKQDNYFPHMNFGSTAKARAEMEAFKVQKVNEAYERAKAEGKSEEAASEAAAVEMLKWEMVKESGEILSSGISRDVLDAISHYNIDFVQLAKNNQGIGLNKRTQNILDREFDMPGYDKSYSVNDMYYENIVRNHYKLIQAGMGNYQIDRMVKRGNFGKHGKDWEFVMRQYLKDSLGHETTFADNLVDITGISPRMNKIFEKSAYRLMSDQAVINGWNRIEKNFNKFGFEAPFLKNAPKVTADKNKDPELYNQQVKARQEYQSRKVHEMGRMEAKFQLMTLLANSGTAVSNIYGGTTMNIASAGFRNVRRANSNKWLTENVIKDKDGNFHLELKELDSKGNRKKVENMKDLKLWLSEQGVIENFIQNELNINAEWRAELAKSGSNAKDFIKEATKIISKNPDVNDATLLELARRYGINKALLKSGAFFMASTERKLRMDSFLAHALQFRDSYGTSAKDLPLSDPAVMRAGLKGIEATQFLYHSAFRPGYMRTSLGKVMTRFKLFVFQSVRNRRELYRRAKYYDFEPGTPAFEKFKDLFVLDMMTFALGAAFKYSLFDTTLPPPYDWIQETSEWVFGDEDEREKAFFGTYPGVLAPLQVVTPPIARITKPITTLINGDWDRFLDYHLHTMYPFGRMVRQVDKTLKDWDGTDETEIINEQNYGTTFGRGMQQFFRLPTDKAVAIYDRKKLKRQRQQEIADNLDWLERNE